MDLGLTTFSVAVEVPSVDKRHPFVMALEIGKVAFSSFKETNRVEEAIPHQNDQHEIVETTSLSEELSKVPFRHSYNKQSEHCNEEAFRVVAEEDSTVQHTIPKETVNLPVSEPSEIIRLKDPIPDEDTDTQDTSCLSGITSALSNAYSRYKVTTGRMKKSFASAVSYIHPRHHVEESLADPHTTVPQEKHNEQMKYAVEKTFTKEECYASTTPALSLQPSWRQAEDASKTSTNECLSAHSTSNIPSNMHLAAEIFASETGTEPLDLVSQPAMTAEYLSTEGSFSSLTKEKPTEKNPDEESILSSQGWGEPTEKIASEDHTPSFHSAKESSDIIPFEDCAHSSHLQTVVPVLRFHMATSNYSTRKGRNGYKLSHTESCSSWETYNDSDEYSYLKENPTNQIVPKDEESVLQTLPTPSDYVPEEEKRHCYRVSHTESFSSWECYEDSDEDLCLNQNPENQAVPEDKECEYSTSCKTDVTADGNLNEDAEQQQQSPDNTSMPDNSSQQQSPPSITSYIWPVFVHLMIFWYMADDYSQHRRVSADIENVIRQLFNL
ncbi:uncharacterized protein LOC122794984 [Protopterus annectens]|uniref:uncharacterized protein LOC122794984 n=1 Tax=Protopterus annectens TaxID=7888 RepID=UPI001CFA32BC|nr:uncharacterized protein LOC122794984 [Protopterus annectens]